MDHIDQRQTTNLQAYTLHFSANKEQILITGATGFIGQALVRRLLNEGHQLIVLTRQPARAQRLLGDQIQYISHLNQLPLHTAIDTLINLAGARILGWRWTSARKAELLRSRIGTTEQLISWIKQAEHKPKRLINASAIGYYGIQAVGDSTELDEQAPPQAIFMSQLCQAWEASAQQALALGVDVSCLRFGVVLGHGGALPMMLMPIRFGLGGPLGSGQQWLSWIHLDDLLRGIAHVWQQPYGRGQAHIYNLTAPHAVNQRQFSQTAAACLHRPCFMPTPAWTMKLALGEQADLLVQGQRVQPRRLLDEGFVFQYPTLESALNQILQRPPHT